MKKVLSVLMAVVMLAAICVVSVSAEEYPSPSDRDYYVIEVDADEGGTANADTSTVTKGDTTKITAKPGDGYEFAGWEFSGDFEWVEGDANSAVIVIRPKADVKFTAKFKGAGVKPDPGKTSPTTGIVDNANFTVVVLAVVISISAAAVVVTGRKYFSVK